MVMIEAAVISGYRITEQIYAGTRTLVYRGIRESDQTPVVIKLMRNEYPSFSEIVQFRNQYTIAKNLDIPSIVKPYSLETYHNGYALVMEFGGISAKDWRLGTGNPLLSSITNFLDLAIQIATTLDQLHRNRVIHKDIKPANILINPQTKQAKLIDFSISSLLPREMQQLQNPNVLEGTLAYISPEQTGRMNRGIDYRTDFYSLGVTFYELLTGELPFVSDDPMELVHSHIAKLVAPVHCINQNIPEILSEIIAKLMAKNAEDRYQSALGLKHDLETCLDQYKETGNIQPFVLGQRDISDRFLIPEKLYGREQEVKALLDAFDRVSEIELKDDTQSKIQNPKSVLESLPCRETLLATFRKIEMILVAGFSGIGKTAVVNEVHKPIVRLHGYFIKGKYDQFQRNIPFSAFVQAFRDLMGQLMSESDAQLQQWLVKILSALGENGQVIIEVIPELERIIGKQPPVPELSGSAAQNRFNLLFQKFIRVFTCKEHPLAMFLDDLQWADSASLKLMQLLMSETDSQYLLVIGAYRDNEVSPAHPFILTVDEIKKAGATVNTITLQPLSFADINHLIADTLSCDFYVAQPLTELVYQKTKGNPFFTTQFLKALYEDKLITFNPPTPLCPPEVRGDERGVGWQCDIAKVRALALTDDVVEFQYCSDKRKLETRFLGETGFLTPQLSLTEQYWVEFMALQLLKLPLQTQSVLKLAACIGNQFDLNTLAIVSLKSPEEAAVDLWRALQEGLILPVSEVYKFYQSEIANSPSLMVNSHEQLAKYRFLHDRVQQAAYSLIPDDKKQVTHLKIGQLLLQRLDKVEQEEKLFDIVGHLNLGIDLITQVAEKEKLAQLNLQAAQKAKSATAYVAASGYLAVGNQLLEAEPWKNQYEFTLLLHEEDAEVSYLLGNFEQMEKMANAIMQNAKTILDQVRIYEIKIQAYVVQNQSPKAVEATLSILKLLGIQLAAQPSMAKVLLGLLGTKIALARKPIDALVNLPNMNTAEKLAATRLCLTATSAAYISAPKLMPLLVFKNLNLSLQFGNHRLSAFGYTWYGVILCGIVGDVQTGYQFGDLSLKILQAFHAKEIECKVVFMVHAFIKPWKNHVKTTLNSLLEAYQAGVNSGDIEYASWAALVYCQHLYLMGFDLTEVEQKAQIYRHIVAQFKQEAAQNYLDALCQLVLNLRGKSNQTYILQGEAYDETIKLGKQIELGDKPGVFFTCLFQCIARYLFGEYQQALESANLAKQHAEGVTSLFVLPNSYFYDSLICLALFAQAPSTQLMKRVQANQKKLRKVADTAPMNHLHQYYLVEAERHRVLGQKTKAMEYYDRAITLAQEQEYDNVEAIANELAAKFYLKEGKEQFAQIYMTNAYYCYARWGALAKVDDLEKHYPQLLTQNTFTTLVIEDATVETNWVADSYIQREQPKSILCLPIINRGNLVSILYLENRLTIGVFTTDRVQLLNLLVSQAAISLENARLYKQAQDYAQQAQNYAQELEKYLSDLKQMQLQLVQSEKMSALGNLVAGVAHEINNPVGFIGGNIEPALDYVKDIFGLLDLYQAKFPQPGVEIEKEIETIDLDYVRSDLPKLLDSMNEGVERICSISDSLRTFSRADTKNKVTFNIHDGIDSTILILKHRLKANENRPAIEVVKDYGQLPQVQCFPGQLNQVFMNLLANAIDALEESNIGRSIEEIRAHPNRITVKTSISADKKLVVISIKDNGIGMSESVKQRIFDHLYTTKTVGKGTGLGLAIARQIVVEKHDGTINVSSVQGEGTEFAINIPV